MNPHPMERVLYNLHQRICSIVLQRTNGKQRRHLERTLFCMFIVCVCLTLVAHVSFVHRDVITADGKPLQSIPLRCFENIDGFSPVSDITHIGVAKEAGARSFVRGLDADSCSKETITVIYSYSTVEGYLYMESNATKKLELDVQYVVVGSSDESCFGSPLLQRLISLIAGYDIVAMNWVLGGFNSTGFIRNGRTMNVRSLSRFQLREGTPWTRFYHQLVLKGTAILKTSFLFFVVTTLVSFTLKETQERMLGFTQQLQLLVRDGHSVSHLVTKHLVESLVFVPIMVGMIFFLIEIYDGDKVIAFIVLSIVWLGEVFSVVSLRSREGIHYFPRIFFLEFSLFHYYLFMFPFGFTYVALASTWCCMIHTMLFFWFRYELPAVAEGQLSVQNPRMTSSQEEVLHSTGSAMSRHGASASRNSFSSGSARDSHALFQIADEEDESSYMLFMGGEVVVHSPRLVDRQDIPTSIEADQHPSSEHRSGTHDSESTPIATNIENVFVDDRDPRFEEPERIQIPLI